MGDVATVTINADLPGEAVSLSDDGLVHEALGQGLAGSVEPPDGVNGACAGLRPIGGEGDKSLVRVAHALRVIVIGMNAPRHWVEVLLSILIPDVSDILVEGIIERAGRSVHRERRHISEDDVENLLRADGVQAVPDGSLDRGDVLAPGEVSGGRRVDCTKVRRRDGALAGVIVSHCG